MNKTFCTHTLVRNGMPFIELVLRQVVPYAHRCLITISERSDDETLAVIGKLRKEFPKIKLSFEKVQLSRLLTHERQKQVDKTYEDWILFLDADDYWPTESLEEMVKLMNKDEDVDGYAVNPYQVASEKHYDDSWRNRWFTKWFKNNDIVYRKPWPRDLIYSGDKHLYWRKNADVKRIATKYFHLSNLMNWKFRDQKKFKDYKTEVGIPLEYPEEQMKNVWKIYEELNRHKTDK